MPSLTVVTPSRWLAGYARESYLGEYPVQVIPNGIALDKFHPVDQGLRGNWASRENTFFWAWQVCGRNGRVMLILNSWRIGCPMTIRLFNRFTKRKMKKLHPKIHGVMRTNSMEELAEYYSMADAYVNTTLEDTFPTTNLEALGLRNPGYYLCHRRKRGVCGRKLR